MEASGVEAVLVAGLLAAVSVAGLAEWLMGSRLAWVAVDAYVLAATVVPVWAAFLPSVAFDAARMPVPRVRAHASGSAGIGFAGLAVRWAWLVPAVGVPVRLVVSDARGATYWAAAIALAASTGFAFGDRVASAARARDELRSFEDRTRAAMRRNRTRLADLAEERDDAARMATLAERTRIAREIHDNVGHLLTRAIMQAQAGRAVADATGDAVASRGFTGVGATLDDAMTMVRRSVHDLEDDGTDFAARMRDAVRSFDGVRPGFAVTFASDVASAPAPVARCFATVVREALANVVHHSDAAGASVTLRDFPAFWQLVISDGGPAKAPAKGDGPSRGMGIADIEARVRALGGSSQCGPYGGGWRVFVSVPKAPWSDVRSREHNGSLAAERGTAS
ncbi:sensor histidine kinase [Bifidobacterium avesanii]